MNKWFKRAGFAAAGLAVAGAIAVAVGLRLADSRMARKVQVHVQPIVYKTDPAVLQRGRYLYTSRGCVDCHGADGGGRSFVQDAGGLHIRGPNISSATRTAVAAYKPEDWVRAIRHGVSPSGRPLMVMPSEDYNRFTDSDLVALVSYVRALPPAQGGPAIVQLPLPARVLYGFGAIRDAAAKIDHTLAPAQPVEEGVNLRHGAYVANMCLGCHGAQLTGGRIPGGPPDWPPAANLRPQPGSGMAAYADVGAFIRMFRTGQRPDGSAIKVMPFESLREISETDLKALHLYLRNLPANPKG
jgi:mono/diheme cytochrome c family protein/cytochrome c5